MPPEEFDVAVAGGSLRVLRWPGGAPLVIAAHGITGNGLAWARVAEHLQGEVTLLAPDLRGRGRSNGLPPPYGMVAHADDLTRVLDHCGAEHAIVVGHSMGGFVVATMAVRHHERVQSIVLVDGGVRLLAPRTDDIDAVIEAVIGPAMRRLSMTFPTRTAYFDFWRAHPAFTGRFDAYVQAYAERDLVGEPPALRSACSLAAVRADGADTLQPDGAAEDWRVLRRPTAMLIAERGMLDQPQGLYPPGLTLPFPVRVIADVNHYTITLGDKGAAATADQILHMVRVSSSSDR